MHAAADLRLFRSQSCTTWTVSLLNSGALSSVSSAMSCLWILFFGSLIATGVRTQEEDSEGSEEANKNEMATDLPPVEAEGPFPSEDGGAGGPEATTEAGTADTVQAVEEPAETVLPEDEPEVTVSEKDPLLEKEEEPITEAPEMDGTTAESGIVQEEAPTVNLEGPEGAESEQTEGESDLSDQVNNTSSPSEEEATKAAADLASEGDVSAENSIGGAENPSDGAGKVRIAGAMAGPNEEESEGSEEARLGSGIVAGVVAAIMMAIIGAVSSYFTYQKKMLCFKAQGRDPERAKEENRTHNDPQALSSLLNSA
ncbi:uncharacterized protein si:ch211-39i22.1 [Electrophorus electricus]|uniref:uncharacterized protein si:ch211-39i22.1 n=1 Tax=Electrophorus electricus TaxID=8005 RepID=UPI0015D07284|nr:uncharacterized protein si:ch211-39i22.1 [Electrophorus electricus]